MQTNQNIDFLAFTNFKANIKIFYKQKYTGKKIIFIINNLKLYLKKIKINYIIRLIYF